MCREKSSSRRIRQNLRQNVHIRGYLTRSEIEMYSSKARTTDHDPRAESVSMAIRTTRKAYSGRVIVSLLGVPPRLIQSFSAVILNFCPACCSIKFNATKFISTFPTAERFVLRAERANVNSMTIETSRRLVDVSRIDSRRTKAHFDPEFLNSGFRK